MKKYNLLDYPFIQGFNITTDEFVTYGIKDALVNADHFEIYNDSAIQNLAIQQLLTAIAGRVYNDILGNDLDGWFRLYNQKSFNTDLIINYLEKWRDSFWLINDEGIPFMQVLTDEEINKKPPLKKNGKEGKKDVQQVPVTNFVVKLDISDNKVSPYTAVWESITIAEAIRWLILYQSGSTQAKFQNQFDKDEKKPFIAKSARGRLTRSLLVSYKGKNLFENIVLNLISRNRKDSLKNKYNKYEKPAWEIIDQFTPNNLNITGDLATVYSMITKRCRLVFDESLKSVTGILLNTRSINGYNTNANNYDPYKVWVYQENGSFEDFDKDHKELGRKPYMPSNNEVFIELFETVVGIKPKEITNKDKNLKKYPYWTGYEIAPLRAGLKYTIDYCIYGTDPKGVMVTGFSGDTLLVDHRVFDSTLDIKDIYTKIIEDYLKKTLEFCSQIITTTESGREKVDEMYKNVSLGVLNILSSEEHITENTKIKVREYMLQVIYAIRKFSINQIYKGRRSMTTKINAKDKIKNELFLLDKIESLVKKAKGCLQ